MHWAIGKIAAYAFDSIHLRRDEHHKHEPEIKSKIRIFANLLKQSFNAIVIKISNVVHRLENSEPEPEPGEPRLEKLRA
jgi:hypothetical protein